MSIHDDRVASSRLQRTSNAWSRVGFSCFPEPPYDNYFNLRYNYSECVQNLRPPSANTVVRGGELLSGFAYYPFGSDEKCYPRDCANRLGVERVMGGYDFVLPSGIRYGYVNNDICLTVAGTFDNPATSDSARALSGWNEITSTPADAQGNFYDDYICGFLKSNGNGFRCFDKPRPPTTKEQAIERYTAEYPPETICAPLKQNSPFQCTRTVEAPMVTRMSLSLASAQAVFALVGILFVAILRKMKKPDQALSTV